MRSTFLSFFKWENLEEEHIESQWITVRPKKLPRGIPILIVGAIYHPPKNDNLAGQFAMILHIQTSLEQILQKHPNTGIILACDLNKLKTSIVASGFHLKQIVNVSTRKKNTLDRHNFDKPEEVLPGSIHCWKIGKFIL